MNLLLLLNMLELKLQVLRLQLQIAEQNQPAQVQEVPKMAAISPRCIVDPKNYPDVCVSDGSWASSGYCHENPILKQMIADGCAIDAQGDGLKPY